MIIWRNVYTWLKNPLLCLFLMGVLQLCIMWPGLLSSDSQVQYAQAIAGAYSDHHPPFMSFIWRYLDKIYPGPGLMLLLQLSLLYGALAFYMKSFVSLKSRLLWLFVPLIPHVFIFSSVILKDVGFAFSFLLCTAYLGYCAAHHQKPRWYALTLVWIILLYGTALKFQAQYCALIVLAWMAFMMSDNSMRSKRFIVWCLSLSLAFYAALYGINRALVPEAQKNHAWQYVKIYDLAGIAARTKDSTFPDFAKLPGFSMEAFLKQFDGKNNRVDELVMSNPAVGHEAILRIGRDPVERDTLYTAWLRALKHHPVFYLQHRFQNLSHTLLSPPGFTMGPRVIEKIAAPHTTTYKILYGLGRALSQGVSEVSDSEIEAAVSEADSVLYDSLGYQALALLAFLGMSHAVPALLCVAYCVLGLRALGRTWAALPLVCMNAVGLALILVLFFCSMAGTLRYTYVMVCMVHASHLFAYRCYQALRSTSLQQSSEVPISRIAAAA
jgi:hypothetical protein